MVAEVIIMSEDRQLEKALFRYRVIVPLLDPDLEPAARADIRKEILSRMYTDPGGKARRVAERTLRQYLQLYREGGFEALKPKGRRDASSSRCIPRAVLEKAVALKKELPNRSIRQIIEILVLDPESGVAEGQIRPSTLAYQLRRLGITGRGLTQTTKAFRRFEKELPNDLWQSDVKHGPYLPDPISPEKTRKTYLVVFLDDHSRLVTHAEFYFAENLVNLLDCFKKALLKYGLPRRVYCDNGMIYVSHQFERICAELGIRHISARPYAPEGKGKIERFNETLDLDFLSELKLTPVQTLPELNAFFWAWLEEGYHHRVNRSTGFTPAVRFAKGNALLRFADPEKIARTFRWQQQRKVDKTACFSFQGNRYEVLKELVGQRITLHYDPFDLSRMEISCHGKQYGNAVVHQLVRQADECLSEEEKRPTVKTGLSYLRLLQEKHEARIKSALGRIRFQDIPLPKEGKDNV